MTPAAPDALFHSVATECGHLTAQDRTLRAGSPSRELAILTVTVTVAFWPAALSIGSLG
jgi:hypothetical protein